jgi:hypothetical protein
MRFSRGDRVRIKNPTSEYTGCRGTIADDPAPGVAVLGHYVAIDGENGRTRPFLIGDLEPLQAARVRNRGVSTPSSAQSSGSDPDDSGGSPGRRGWPRE